MLCCSGERYRAIMALLFQENRACHFMCIVWPGDGSNEKSSFSFSETKMLKIWTQLFKTNDVVRKHIVKTSVIKYGIYANIFAEKM